MGSQSYTNSFATIYDDVMKIVPYYSWYKYLKHILYYYDKNPKKIMELACGTGNMMKYFSDGADKIYGIDKSEDMLAIAQNKFSNNGNVKFFNTDMSRKIKYNNFDFIYSVFDSMNYILEFEELINVFENVYLNLIKEGIFVFDINTEYRLMDIGEGRKKLTGDNYTCYWKDIVDKENGKWIVELNIYLNRDDEIKNFTETHVETSYPLDKIKKGLLNTGFQHVDYFRSFTFNKGDPKNDRIHFVALKQKPEVSYLKQIMTKIKWNIISPFISRF
ncbi:MAG: class I SAM-dependent methyltransferase [Halanaerobiales bacterium]